MRKKKERRKKEYDKIQLFRRSVSQLPRTQWYVHECFLRTARQYHSLCVLGLGFVASLANIWVINNYGKFKISIAIPK